MVVCAIPLIVMLLRHIVSNCPLSQRLEAALAGRLSPLARIAAPRVPVLAPDIHRGVIPALQYARTISEDAKAIHIATDPTREERVRRRWMQWSRGVPLIVVKSPYRSLVDPVVSYIDRLQGQETQLACITIIVPEFLPNGWFPKLLHGQAGLLLSDAAAVQAGRGRHQRAVSY